MRFFSRNWVMFVDSPRAREPERLAKPVKTYSARHNYAMRFLLCFSYFIYYIFFKFSFLLLCEISHIFCTQYANCGAVKSWKQSTPDSPLLSPSPTMNHPWIALWVWKILAVQFLTIAILPFIIWQECLLRIPPPPSLNAFPPLWVATVASKSFSATFMSHTQRARTLVQIESQSKIYAIHK